MEHRIICKHMDGFVSILCPAPEALAAGWTLEQIASKDAPSDTVDMQIVPVEEISSDRTYRDAWEFDGSTRKIFTSMPKAREVHKNHMRKVRDPLFRALDLAYLIADEAKDEQEKTRIRNLKVSLRDVTLEPGIEAATTPDELKLVWPSILGDNPLV